MLKKIIPTILHTNILGDEFTVEDMENMFQNARSLLASGITIAKFASNASRRVVGQWGGAGGAGCEDHFGVARELVRVARGCDFFAGKLLVCLTCR